MNYLAHSFLSFKEPHYLVGNYLGDFVRNKEMDQFPDPIQRGIKLHREIDAYTDVHPQVKLSTRLLHAAMHKYAPVVIDIYFDYLLSKHWQKYTEQSLISFCARTYEILEEHKKIMPERIQNRLIRMLKGRWLENYQTYPDLEKTFYFLSRRAKFSSRLEEAPAILQGLESKIENHFNAFFPEAIQFVQKKISEMEKY